MSKGSDDLTFGQKVVGGLIGAINNTHGTAAVGHHAVGGPIDPATQDLLSGVRELRSDLQRLRESSEIVALDEVLGGVEDEITSTGQASLSQRERLRVALSNAQTVASVLASAGAVAGMLGM